MSTEDRNRVIVNLNGINCGTWETIAGREMSAEGDKFRPAAGEAQRAWGGPTTYSDITLTRTYDDTQEALIKTLRKLGAKASGEVTEIPLDINYESFDKSTVWPVRLQGIKAPDTDINSGNRRIVELTFWVDGDPS